MKIARIQIGIAFFLLLSCQTATQNKVDNASENKWSVQMADSIMEHHPQLAFYDKVPGKEKLQYDVAMMGMAIDKLGYIDKKYSVYLKNYVDFFVDSLGQIRKYRINEYNLDRINFAKNLITLYKRTGDQRYSKAIEKFVEQIEGHPRTNSGGFWHKKIYEKQMWLDGTYMAGPFLTQYAKEFNRPEWYDLATLQLTHIYEKTVDEQTGLLYHAWDESQSQAWCDPETGRSGEFWGRAIGWYMMALVDVLDYLPEKHPGRAQIVEILNNVSEALLAVMDKESGVWYQVLNKPGQAGNYLEASATAMYTYAFAKGARNGYLPSSYGEIAKTVFDDMLEEFVMTNSEGQIVIRNICGGCGLGGNPYRDGSYEYYVSEKRVLNDPKGVGAFLLAAIELEN